MDNYFIKMPTQTSQRNPGMAPPYPDSTITSSLYITANDLAGIIRRVQSDTDYYRFLYNAEPTIRDMIDVWRYGSQDKVKKLVDQIRGTAQAILDDLVNGNGIYAKSYYYWIGGSLMSRQAPLIGALVANGLVDGESKEQLEAAMVLFASILWDDDTVPMYEGHNLNMGNANMPVQYLQDRNLFALALLDHPMMARRGDSVVSGAVESLRAEVNEYGAQRAAVHYISASMGPLLSTLEMLKGNSSGTLVDFAGQISQDCLTYGG